MRPLARHRFILVAVFGPWRGYFDLVSERGNGRVDRPATEPERCRYLIMGSGNRGLRSEHQAPMRWQGHSPAASGSHPVRQRPGGDQPSAAGATRCQGGRALRGRAWSNAATARACVSGTGHPPAFGVTTLAHHRRGRGVLGAVCLGGSRRHSPRRCR